MATRAGRFGRRRRASGNLTAIVAQLYREQRAAEDRVMFDAYQNGGLVDGKPVDDTRIRAYIVARRDGLSVDDALYDEWNNRLIQVDFKIGEEKITLAFQQGKVGAGAVAAYYRGQLSSIPKDSAFYREVAGRAAQWAKAVGSAARGRARAGLLAGLQSKLDAVAKTQANYMAIEDIVRRAAVRAGLIDDNDPIAVADASKLRALFNAGILNNKGNPITFDDWRGASVAAYHAFDTKIALNKQLNRGVIELTEQKGKFLEQVLMGTNAIEPREAYEAARDVWLEAVEHAQGNPSAILAAAAKYTAALEKIQATASGPTGLEAVNDEFIGGLVNEISAVRDGKYSGPGVADLYPRSDADDFDKQMTEGDDTYASAISKMQVLADAKALDSGAAYYGQNEFGGNLGVVYYPPGAALDPFGRKGLGADTQPAVLAINGKPTQVMLKGQPVTTSGLVVSDAGAQRLGLTPGQPVQSVPNGSGGFIPVQNLSAAQVAYFLSTGAYEKAEGDGQVVGYVFQQGTKTTYGVFDTEGNIKFTTQNPFGGAFAPLDGGTGFTVFTPTDYAPSGEGVIMSPPTIDLTNANGLLVDPGVMPSVLRKAAENAATEAERDAYLAMADKRQAEIRASQPSSAELAVESHRQMGPGVNPLGEFVGGVNDFVRNAIGVIAEAAAAPPKLGGMGGPRLGDTPPQVGAPPPVAPPAVKPPPVAAPPPPTAPPTGPSGAPGAYYPPPKPPEDVKDAPTDWGAV